VSLIVFGLVSSALIFAVVFLTEFEAYEICVFVVDVCAAVCIDDLEF
jgi:hypothetical protein